MLGLTKKAEREKAKTEPKEEGDCSVSVVIELAAACNLILETKKKHKILISFNFSSIQVCNSEKILC